VVAVQRLAKVLVQALLVEILVAELLEVPQPALALLVLAVL
jgi:hypothetical protein